MLMRKMREYFPKHSTQTIKIVMKRCGNDMTRIIDEMLNENEDETLTHSSSSESKATYDSDLE